MHIIQFFFNYEHLQYGHLCKSTLIGHINERYFWCLRWKLSHWVQRCSSLRIVITISYSFKLSFSKKYIGCTVNTWIKVCFNWSYKTHKFTTFPEGTSTSEVTSMLKSSSQYWQLLLLDVSNFIRFQVVGWLFSQSILSS